MLRYDFSNLYSDSCTSGNTVEEVKGLNTRYEEAMKRLKADMPGFIGLLDDTDYTTDILEWIEEDFRGKYEHFVVLGIGGSALGNIALQKSLKPINWNRMSSEQRKGLPTIDVWDNVDPDFIASNREVIDIEKTMFNVISKSGTTAEAMSNYLIIRNEIVKRGLDPKDHFVFTTDPEKGVLNKIIEQDGIKKFVIPPSVGGRFSVLTPVGLISAAAAGIDINMLIEGAKKGREMVMHTEMEENPGALIAVHHLLFGDKGMKINIMFAYSNALYLWADWYRQLWAESLGKELTTDGEKIHYGLTPIKAIGPTDQHSQVQLYNDGPDDKVITFLKVDKFNNTVKIPALHTDIDALTYLGDKTLNELINAEQKATAYAVKNHGRPNMTVEFPEINEENVGEFIFVYEFATALLGYMMKINPFDQPGVEDGKIYTYALMGRKGFEDKREELEK
ncbi:MAG TPA: glucose-6-phosphate isomerase [Thermotogota bacterium]|nr:glucose-6-phosphate isomerase [Thermotogota bacterium]HPJ88655.1 glucose-6-phosphate isomerase [Thermotogota bacterium]